MGAPTIWIPSSARPEPRVVLRCNVCEKKFHPTQRQQFERHVKSCAKKNLDVIQQMVADRQDPFTDVQDKEQYAWVRKLAAEVGPTEANKRLRGKR